MRRVDFQLGVSFSLLFGQPAEVETPNRRAPLPADARALLEMFEDMAAPERRALLQITRSMSRKRPRLAPMGDNVIEIRTPLDDQ